ncbi:ParB/RepB/Spo0J family partition protein [Salinisphaera orenii]|uniref:ParB/RepB/Spo0J family partition protein n=1 Tax=Salinisphaera orenii TaxID=856731 RepID=UPI000DBE5AA5
MTSRSKRGLGRGLEALLSEEATADEQQRIVELPVEELTSGRHQPRQSMNDEALDALTRSIQAQGIVQPLVVRVAGEGYEIVAGERRWLAAQRANFAYVPALIRAFDDQTASAVALIENIQREELDAVDESVGLARLINEFGLTHAQCAEAVGRSRASVSNLLRLAELASEVREHVRAGRLNMGHARTLLGLDVADQSVAGEHVIAHGLTVRQTERLVRDWPNWGGADATRDEGDEARAMARSLTDNLAMPVRVTTRARGGGRVTIDFSNREELDALAGRLGLTDAQDSS